MNDARFRPTAGHLLTSDELEGYQQQAYYNRGNAFFRAGEAEQDLQAKQAAWQKSLGDFDSAMKLDAADSDAKHNYDYVKRKLEELKQQQQQQQQQNQDSQKDQSQDQQKQQDQQGSQDQGLEMGQGRQPGSGHKVTLCT